MDKLSILEQRIRHIIERTKNQIHDTNNRAYIDSVNRYVELGLKCNKFLRIISDFISSFVYIENRMSIVIYALLQVVILYCRYLCHVTKKLRGTMAVQNN